MKHWTIQCLEILFVGKFRIWFAIYITSGAGWYLYKVSFAPPDTLSKFTETIVGFMLGTAIATVINFVFGTSQSSQDKTKLINGGEK